MSFFFHLATTLPDHPSCLQRSSRGHNVGLRNAVIPRLARHVERECELRHRDGSGLTQLRRFEHFRAPKWLRLLRPTPKGRHYSGIGGTGPAVILGGGWAGNSSFSFSSKRLSSGSGSV